MPEVIINGPEGRIEGRYTPGKTEDAPIALFLHPHPVHGGTMNNKVVYAMFHHFAQRGFATLRFNFRGVGRSQGTYDKGEGELSDAASVLDWLQSQNPNAKQCWVAGFSFGAWIGMQLLMRRPEINGFISVAPPANMYDFSFLAPCPSSGLMLQGDADDIVPHDSVEKLAEKLNLQQGIHVEYHLEAGADHFFAEKLDNMTDRISAYLDANGPDRI
ncbi:MULTISPECIES: alpha/beta hydrolase [Curvivirga]|uniref:alpha/beta hydrolase n=1 Tax=Curvivirga TaxID=2856846 RepID=UPI0012BC3681|nr:alpha/beta hydrolase [Curvivirga aplysinae]MTI09521.1 alpha/beta fold hydrolase [Curvivirga aplysinae]